MKAKIRIGIDFDNTIICYDDLFEKAISQKKWDLGEGTYSSKSTIKQRLIDLDGNDFRWQEIQAIVYGILIEHAQPFPGLIETLEYFKSKLGAEIYIVSHKTPTSNYIKEITFIDKAIAWIEKNNLYQYVQKENIFFLPTRREKILKITDLDLGFFVDDLIEVLEDETFPPINKLFFSPEEDGFSHWEKIKNYFSIAHELGLNNLKDVEKFAQPPYLNFEFIKRDGNNKIIKFSDRLDQNFIIKKYSLLNKSYSTLETEFQALQLLKKHHFSVPTPFYKNSLEGFALYEYISPSPHKPKASDFISGFSDFLTQLFSLSTQLGADSFTKARDSRSKIADYKMHVQRRLEQIEIGCKEDKKFSDIESFIHNTFKPIHQRILEQYEMRLKKFELNEMTPIEQKQKILSPSDFGTHNAIFNQKNQFTYIDFEYFGWDDPVKLVADFLHHAGQEMAQEDRSSMLIRFIQNASFDDIFLKRLATVLDLIGLEWILIILNIASPDVLQRRIYANPQLDVQKLIQQRLNVATHRIKLFQANINRNSTFLSLEAHHIPSFLLSAT